MLCCGKSKKNDAVEAVNNPNNNANFGVNDSNQAGAPAAANNAIGSGGATANGGAANGANKSLNPNLILGKFELVQGKAGMLGEGSFSVVQKGIDRTNGDKEVAVKTYKLANIKQGDEEEMENVLKKFKRQIEVLQLLMEPIETKGQKWKDSLDKRLCHNLLFKTDPRKCFLDLVDYSKDARGEPGPDVSDGKMYVVTEVADYSLKDYLAARKEEHRDMSLETVRRMCKSYVAAMAMLHIKGFAHLDMKPENIMRAGTTWRVIDVDGCTPLNKNISINDSSISFSPCYCAPEWASFLIEDGETLKVGHELDVWSVGISLCELIMLDAVLKPKYVSIYKQSGSHRKAGFLFLEWLANPKQSLSLDEKIGKFHSGFTDMCLTKMLTKDANKRCSLAECLDHDFLKDCVVPGLDDNNTQNTDHLGGADAARMIKMRRDRLEEAASDKPPIMHGLLYKLNADGDKSNADHWLKRDIWLAHNGNLCYLSQKKGKRLVLVDLRRLASSKIEKVSTESSDGSAMPHIFTISIGANRGGNNDQNDSAQALHEDEENEIQTYAAESPELVEKWVKVLTEVSSNPDRYTDLDAKVAISEGLIADFRNFKIQIRNRREKIDTRKESQYQPVFEKELWKLNSDGDTMKEEDWTFRNMWLAKNGAFCYFSKKENKELMYYRPEDIRDVTYRKLGPSESCRPYSFEMQLKGQDGMEYAPGVFAAQDEEVMEIILGCVEKYQAIKGARKNRLSKKRT